jgi:hypothetical protein
VTKIPGSDSHFLIPRIKDKKYLSSPFLDYFKLIKWKIAAILHACNILDRVYLR